MNHKINAESELSMGCDHTESKQRQRKKKFIQLPLVLFFSLRIQQAEELRLNFCQSGAFARNGKLSLLGQAKQFTKAI